MSIYKAGTIFIYGKNHFHSHITYIELLIDLPITSEWIEPVNILYGYYDFKKFYINDIVLATEEEIKHLNKLLTFQ